MKKPDILIFMSDQHSPLYEKAQGGPVDTPNLDRLRADGISFREAYTSCPLCVPARMSMLSGILPSKTGILTNNDTLPNTTPTFLHPLAADGYETVLIGRMHFVGTDQRHGFVKRLAGDITPVSWTRPGSRLDQERGVFKSCFGVLGCTDVTGGGESPVQYYDRMVVDTALEYLSKKHEKPQCIVVGTYAPHFPYVAPIELYQKYKDKISLSRYSRTETSYPLCPPLQGRQKNNVTEETMLETLAAYCGLIEFTDGLIGEVYDAFRQYNSRKESKGYFLYLSDHGDQVGERKIFGKTTFFEKAAKIPMIVQGPGIKAGSIIKSPVSIMDIGPTVCGLAKTESISEGDGISLVPSLFGLKENQERIIVSEVMGKVNGIYSYGMMVRWRDYKYITYHGFESQDMLFDLKQDPEETKNLYQEKPELLEWFQTQIDTISNPDESEKRQLLHDRNAAWFRAYEKMTGIDNSEHWGNVPECAKLYPAVH